MVKLSSTTVGDGTLCSVEVATGEREPAIIASMCPVRFLVGLTRGLVFRELRPRFRSSEATDLGAFVLVCKTDMLDCAPLMTGRVGLAAGLLFGDVGCITFLMAYGSAVAGLVISGLLGLRTGADMSEGWLCVAGGGGAGLEAD